VRPSSAHYPYIDPCDKLDYKPHPIFIMRQPLSSVRVLDLTRVRSGPTAVRQLADWGADVIKIESTAGPEAELFGDSRGSSDFQNLQRNKRSCTLNLKSADGLAIFKHMAETADVIVENFRPDVKERLGIDYPTMRAVNPRIIYASISGFGQDGPYSKRPGFDQVVQGMGGLMSITGLPGQGPVRAGIPLADLSAGLLAAQGIFLALYDRERTGRGQWVTTSLLQAQVQLLDFQATRWLDDHEVPGQAGNNHPTNIPTGVFQTSDGYINVAASGQSMWERLCPALGAPELLSDARFGTPKLRSEHRDALNHAIGQRLATATSAHWCEALNSAGVPCGPIHTIDEVFADPQVRHLAMVEEIASPYYDPLRVVAQPFRLSEGESGLRTRPPEWGEHTDEILLSLGYSDEDIAGFRQRGVI
jgi:crotonobetainyl-CoA:carnitine CoA-transferase CaiB-like acyl-CoA transferase